MKYKMRLISCSPPLAPQVWGEQELKVPQAIAPLCKWGLGGSGFRGQDTVKNKTNNLNNNCLDFSSDYEIQNTAY